MRKLALLIIFLLIAGGATFGFIYREDLKDYFSKESYSPEAEKEHLAQAKAYLEEDHPQKALEIAERYRQRFDDSSDIGKKWLKIFIDSAVAARNPGKLLLLYDHYPLSVKDHEEATLLIADVLINTSRSDDYSKLREQWQGRETQEDRWFVLDADRLLVDGRRVSAVNFLNSRSFEGTADVGRLIRLALLTARENPRMAWEYLAEANSKDPNNTDVHSYRARLLEAVGKTSLALTEYLVAARLDPDNVLLRDQVAEFYRRHGRYKLAQKVWEDALEMPGSDFIWLKTWFWGRVATPTEFNWSDKSPSESSLHPLLSYALSLDENTFWDEDRFQQVPDNNRYLQAQQATYWLRLIQALKEGREDRAWEMLQYNHFTPISWAPQLETLLKRILKYRKEGTLVVENAFDDNTEKALSGDIEGEEGSEAPKRHPFVTQIETLAESQRQGSTEALPEGLHQLLISDNAFAAAFLAGGWLETALQLPRNSILDVEYPEWVAYGFTQGLRYNRGNLQALEFATKQKSTPAMDMLIGELLIASGSPDAGLEKLKPLSAQKDDIGFRSAWLVSLLYIEQKKFDDAKTTIKEHPMLQKNVIGRETLARIALLEGDQEGADKLYSALETDSWEAKSYLARKAFAEENWRRARELTEDLLREFPNNMLLRKNLNRIIEEQKKQES